MPRHRITRALFVILVLALPSAPSAAQNASAVRKLAESTLLVTGHIVIGPDGSTQDVDIDRPEALPKEIVGFVGSQMTQWKFKPVEQGGKPVRARTSMTVRVVAKRVEGKQYEVQIRSASFGGGGDGSDARTDGSTVRALSMTPPHYPRNAVENQITGTVFVVLRIVKDGKASDVVAEQTNLRIAAGPNDMTRFRKLLEGSAIAAAKEWRFAPPSSGELADDGEWSIRVPVNYSFDPVGEDAYGRWDTYIPGPRNRVPWVDGDKMMAGSAGGADAVGNGGLQLVGTGPQLLTPLGPG